MSLVSIIVPVYNAEDFIEECIQSILEQSYTQFELILINDGSTDNSLEICEKYEAIDNRIILLDQMNSGVSSARNAGLNKATGDYIQFIDSDDIVLQDFIKESVYSFKKSNSDLVIKALKKVNTLTGEEMQHYVVPNIESISKTSFLNNYIMAFMDSGVFNYPVNKMYKRNIIRENNLFFNKDITLAEDVAFNLEYMRYVESLTLLDSRKYIYRVGSNENSLSQIYKKYFFQQRRKTYFFVMDFINSQSNEHSIEQRTINNWYRGLMIYTLNQLFKSSLSIMDKQECLAEIMSDDIVKNVFVNSENLNLEQKIIIFCSKHDAVRTAVFYHKFKKFLREDMKLVFTLMKRLNNLKNRV